MSLTETLKTQKQQSKEKSEQKLAAFENSETPIQTEGKNAMLQMMLEKTMKRIEVTTANYEEVTDKALETVSESMDELTETVESYKKSNEILYEKAKEMTSAITSSIHDSINNAYSHNIATMQTAAKESITEIQKVADTAVEEINTAIEKARSRERNFFTWVGVKNVVFYLMAAATVVETAILIFKTFKK